jgi:hypothetical protein
MRLRLANAATETDCGRKTISGFGDEQGDPATTGQLLIADPECTTLFHALMLLPLTKCKTRRMTPTTSRMWNKPVDTGNANSPSNQAMIKIAALIPNTISSPYI